MIRLESIIYEDYENKKTIEFLNKKITDAESQINNLKLSKKNYIQERKNIERRYKKSIINILSEEIKSNTKRKHKIKTKKILKLKEILEDIKNSQ